MSVESFEAAFIKRMNLLMDDSRNTMIRGAVKNYEDYRELRGKILGYEKVMYEFTELMKTYKERNDQ